MKDILWPQKQEDRAEGGWKTLTDEKPACDTRVCEPEDASTSALPKHHPANARGPDAGAGLSGDQISAEPASNLPVIAEKVIDEPIRSRGPKQSDDMV